MPAPPFGPLKTALNALANLTVTGVTRSFPLDALPQTINRAQLPALLVVPMLDTARRRQYGEFQVAAPSGDTALVNYLITHLLIHAPVGSGVAPRSHLPTLIDLVDNYAAAIRADPHLNTTLFYPANYSVFIAPVRYGGLEYHAAQFWHTLTVEV